MRWPFRAKPDPIGAVRGWNALYGGPPKWNICLKNIHICYIGEYDMFPDRCGTCGRHRYDG